MTPLLSIHIKSPEKTIWEGEGEYVSSVNSQGPFDILPLHANFITIVENHPIKIKSEGKVTEYNFNRSVIYVHSNNVSIYVNI